MKVEQLEKNRLQFYCPGCRKKHEISLDKYFWNHDDEIPSLFPAIRIEVSEKICEFTIRAGWIDYKSSSTHTLKDNLIKMHDL
jgi:hypothetical protein